MTLFNHPDFHDHEQVVFHHDAATGLRAIIAIHDSRLGPGVGGCRMYPYTSDQQALTDVLRLSRGMTYKSALAGMPFGGAKSVIMGDPRHEKTDAMLRSMGDAVERLGGRYIIAEDSGTNPDDMRVVAQRTSHVSGLEDNAHGGDPSPSTALGVFAGLLAGVRTHYGTDSIEHCRVLLQGLGHVGFALAAHLRNAGAEVFACDLHSPNVERAERELGVIAVAPENLLTIDAEVFAPCALGGVINPETLQQLNVGVIAGAANNQLANAEVDDRLLERGITYCPDFAINAGGIIEVYHQGLGSEQSLRDQAIHAIGGTVAQILERARMSRRGTQRVAIEMAEERIRCGTEPLMPGVESTRLRA